MKLIHLSDLHLGKRVNEYSMLEDQEYILKKIINVIDDEKPDGVIIAGDVYDKSIPSAEAVQLFDDFLVQLAKRSLKVFVISGNHDFEEEHTGLADVMIEKEILAYCFRQKKPMRKLLFENSKEFPVPTELQKQIMNVVRNDPMR